MSRCCSPFAASIRSWHPHCPGQWLVSPHPALPLGSFHPAHMSPRRSTPCIGLFASLQFPLWASFFCHFRSLQSLSLNLSSGGDARFEPCCGRSVTHWQRCEAWASPGCEAFKRENWDGDLPVPRVANQLSLFSLHLPDSCSPVGSPLTRLSSRSIP